MNTTNNNDALTLDGFLAMTQEDRADVDYTQAPALYAGWCEKYQVHVEPHHVQKPDADVITYRVRIWAPGEGSHPVREMWIDYQTGTAWVQQQARPFRRDGWEDAPHIHYRPKDGGFDYKPWGKKPIDTEKWHDISGVSAIYRVKQPTAADILWCLRSDADALNYDRYEDWAADMGYDPDSREGERIYNACRENGVNLRRVAGAEAWAVLAVLLELPGL